MDGKANFAKINPTQNPIPKFALSTEPGRNRTFFSISIMLMCVPITPQVRVVLRQHLFSNMHSKIFKVRIHVTKYNRLLEFKINSKINKSVDLDPTRILPKLI